MKDTITVICPVRNMEGRLENLKSWVGNCDLSFQIILICDSSTDNTLCELQEIKSDNPYLRIEILEGSFGSPGCARNAGLEQAKNNLVVFWDSDDVGDPRLLSKEIRTYDFDSLDAVVFGYEIYSDRRKLKMWTPWPNTRTRCLDKVSLNPGIWRFCFKLSSLQEARFLSLKMGEDQLFMNHFLRKSPKIEFNNTVTYRYYVNVESQLTSDATALGDLSGVVKILLSQLNSDKSNQRFTIRILGKILATQIKRCKVCVKIQAFINLIQLTLWFPKEIIRLIASLFWRKFY